MTVDATLKTFLPNCVSPRINSCPNNCSGHGRCSTANSVLGRVYCECDEYWKGEACDIPYCRDNCGSPDHGYCDLTGEKLCVCNDSWQGKETNGGQVEDRVLSGKLEKRKWWTEGVVEKPLVPLRCSQNSKFRLFGLELNGLCREKWAEGEEKAREGLKCCISTKALLILVICMSMSPH